MFVMMWHASQFVVLMLHYLVLHNSTGCIIGDTRTPLLEEQVKLRIDAPPVPLGSTIISVYCVLVACNLRIRMTE
jgi:hypothetical protein